MNESQPTDQKRLLMAVCLSAVVILLWSVIFPPQKPPQPPAESAPASSAASGAPSGTGTTASAAPSSGGPAADLSAIEERTASLEKPGRHAVTVTNRDGQIGRWELLDEQYRTRTENGTEPFRFVTPPSSQLTRGAFLPPDIVLNVGGQVLRGAYTLNQSGTEVTATHVDEARRLTVERIYRPAQATYGVEVTVRLRNGGAAPVDFGLVARLRGAQNAKEASAGFMAPPIYLFEGLCALSDKLERQNLDAVRGNRADPEAMPRFTNGLRYAGVDNRYFLTGLVPGPEGLSTCELFVGAEAAGVAPADISPDTSYLVAQAEMPGGTVPPGGVVERTFQLYGGPKKLDALGETVPPLTEAVDFGLLSPLCVVMVSTLRWFYGLIPNWAVAIILLTIVVKLITLPLTHKQYKSMAAMKAIQPQLKALQDKYKDDRMRLQQEMMALYKAHGVNPLAGCLPVLAMMPVYIALYRTIYSSVELYQAPLGLWIHDLSERDPTYILPVLLGVLFLVQARLNPPSGDAMQQKLMTTFMPILFTAMMLFLPSGLVVYILCNTLLGIAQQAYMNKAFAPPTAAPEPARGRS